MKNTLTIAALVAAFFAGLHIGKPHIPAGAQGVTIWSDGATDAIIRQPDGNLQAVALTEPAKR